MIGFGALTIHLRGNHRDLIHLLSTCGVFANFDYHRELVR